VCFCRPCSHLFRSTLALRRSAHSKHDLFRLPSRSTLKPQAWNFFLQLVHLMTSLTCSGSDAADMFISFYIRVCLSNWSGRRGGRLHNCLRWCLLAMCVHVARFFCGRFHGRAPLRLCSNSENTKHENTKDENKAANWGKKLNLFSYDSHVLCSQNLCSRNLCSRNLCSRNSSERLQKCQRREKAQEGARWGEWMQWAGSVVASGGGNPHNRMSFSYGGEMGGMDAVEGVGGGERL
jgi:hypothetical protein